MPLILVQNKAVAFSSKGKNMNNDYEASGSKPNTSFEETILFKCIEGKLK